MKTVLLSHYFHIPHSLVQVSCETSESNRAPTEDGWISLGWSSLWICPPSPGLYNQINYHERMVQVSLLPGVRGCWPDYRAHTPIRYADVLLHQSSWPPTSRSVSPFVRVWHAYVLCSEGEDRKRTACKERRNNFRIKTKRLKNEQPDLCHPILYHLWVVWKVIKSISPLHTHTYIYIWIRRRVIHFVSLDLLW